MLFPFKINVDFLFFYFYKPVYQIINTRHKQHCTFRTIEETIRIRKTIRCRQLKPYIQLSVFQLFSVPAFIILISKFF